MLVKLLKQHVINGALRERNEVVDVSVVTPEMEGLDPTARAAIRQEKIRVFGRWVDSQHTRLLDDPPIPRPIEENQPVESIPAGVPR